VDGTTHSALAFSEYFEAIQRRRHVHLFHFDHGDTANRSHYAGHLIFNAAGAK
jgi:hypothetical protein